MNEHIKQSFAQGGSTIKAKICLVIRMIVDIRPILGLLESGRFIRGVAIVFFRTVAIVVALVLAVFWFRSWPFIQNLGWQGGVAFFIWQVSFPYAVFMTLQVLYFCARDDGDEYDSEYVIAPS